MRGLSQNTTGYFVSGNKKMRRWRWENGMGKFQWEQELEQQLVGDIERCE